MTLLSKTTWAMQKKQNKRCLPKEGRPHAHGVCQKKREKKRCIPKEGMPYACKGMSKKMLIAHVENNKGRKSQAKGVQP